LRKLKGLEDIVGLAAVGSFMGDDGWAFYDEPGVFPDTVNGARYLREVYQRAEPSYTGRVTTPILWDREKETIVNNESRDIIRMFDHEFDAVPSAKPEVKFCPEDLREEVDRTLDELYKPVNNGVYKTGFATTQDAYEEGRYRAL
jgi:putative glutathione S-transferase